MAHLHEWQLMLAGSSARDVIWSACAWPLHGAWTSRSMSLSFKSKYLKKQKWKLSLSLNPEIGIALLPTFSVRAARVLRPTDDRPLHILERRISKSLWPSLAYHNFIDKVVLK